MRTKNTYSRFVQNTSGWPDSHKGKMIHLLHHCVEHDITSFDNADFQGNIYPDRTFGTALSESGLSRDEIQLISKVRIENAPDLVSAVDTLLLDLRTDYLDLVLLNSSHSSEETNDAVEQLISQGKIVEIGGLELEDIPSRTFKFPLRATQFQSPFQSSEAFKALETKKLSEEEGIGLVHCDFKEPSTEGREKVFNDLCQHYNCTRNQLLLMWILGHQDHLHPVLYAGEMEEITEAVAAKEKQLEPLDWQKIKLLLS